MSQISEKEAKKAIQTLIQWIGENPEREGLRETPQRIIDSYKEYFSGYHESPDQILKKTFTEISGYQDMILLKDIKFYSHCEHHIAPIRGVAHIAYYPNNRVVGISKLAKVVEIHSKRLQIQERLTADIANTIHNSLQTKGVAVLIDAYHSCINNRGVKQLSSQMKTHVLIGCFKHNQEISDRLFQLIIS